MSTIDPLEIQRTALQGGLVEPLEGDEFTQPIIPGGSADDADMVAGGIGSGVTKALSRVLSPKQNIFENVWIQPASGDAGSSLGAALIAWYEYCLLYTSDAADE
mgnify:CR=1 FL=1